MSTSTKPRVKTIPVGKVKKGEFLKWDHLKWRKVAYIGSSPKDKGSHQPLIPDGLEGGWAYIKFEDSSSTYSIWHDVELPWRE